MKKYSEQEIEKASQNSRATLEIDGLFIDDEDEEMAKKVLRGEITHDGHMTYALNKAKKKRKHLLNFR
ncbi:MAG: antitoxin VbhA family protein [Clostridiales bacterium]|nr:antitoxin VbhA family protein [Clostridiales bacterium]